MIYHPERWYFWQYAIHKISDLVHPDHHSLSTESSSIVGSTPHTVTVVTFVTGGFSSMCELLSLQVKIGIGSLAMWGNPGLVDMPSWHHLGTLVIDCLGAAGLFLPSLVVGG